MTIKKCCPDWKWEQGRDLLADECERSEAEMLYEKLNEELEAARADAAAGKKTTEEQKLWQRRNALALHFLPLMRKTARGYAYRNGLYDTHLYDDLCQEGWLITVRLLKGHEAESPQQAASFMKLALRPRVRHIAYKLRFEGELSLDGEDGEALACKLEDRETEARFREAELKADLLRRLDTQ